MCVSVTGGLEVKSVKCGNTVAFDWPMSRGCKRQSQKPLQSRSQVLAG